MLSIIVVVAFLLVAGRMFFSALFLNGRADLRSFFQPSPFSPSMLLGDALPPMPWASLSVSSPLPTVAAGACGGGTKQQQLLLPLLRLLR
jgi:hypothetical protein